VSDDLNLNNCVNIWHARTGTVTNLRDTITSGSNETPVLAARVTMQVRRELGLNCLSWLDRNNDIAGQVCNSCHYSKAIAVSTVTRSRLGSTRGAEQGSREK
jgi:hypothetical protein